MIEIKKLCRSYGGADVLKDIQLNIEPGTFTAILGRNGSGKSTLARHLNALLKPQRGSVTVDGISAADEAHVFDIREKVGMVFQNPEAQAVAAIVEDDTAFAPENLGLPEKEILERIEFALRETGLLTMRRRAISELSGGQKQLTAISGILAMKPRYMIFDESSSMLDPSSRKRVLSCVMKLKEELGLAVIWITHYMEEAAAADRIIIINDGIIQADGTPSDIFSDTELIEKSGLALPPCAQLCLKLRQAGMDIPSIPINTTDCALILREVLNK